MILWTAFTIGLFGSLHCIGMCGPIALALPYQGNTKFATTFNALLYNFGRIFGYSIIGILPGLLGKGLFIAGFQKNLSLALGVFLLLAAIFSFNLERKIVTIPLIDRFNGFVQTRLSRLLKRRTRQTLFGVGFVNAYLPCGLVYMALAGALTQNSVLGGSYYMAMFGLGTIPMMLALGLSGQIISIRIRNMFRKMVPVFMLLFAALFIFRGLNIDLPLDLQFWIDQGSPPRCH